MDNIKYRYRIKYWRRVNDHYGEWVRTGLITKYGALKTAEFFLKHYENVNIYEDDNT